MCDKSAEGMGIRWTAPFGLYSIDESLAIIAGPSFSLILFAQLAAAAKTTR